MNNVWIFPYYVIESGPEGKKVKSEETEIQKSHLQKNVGVGWDAFFHSFWTGCHAPFHRLLTARGHSLPSIAKSCFLAQKGCLVLIWIRHSANLWVWLFVACSLLILKLWVIVRCMKSNQSLRLKGGKEQYRLEGKSSKEFLGKALRKEWGREVAEWSPN